VLVARREALLAELGRAISQEFDVQYRALAMDLSQEGFIAGLADATDDIDIGLVVSNAGTPNPGEFLKLDRQLLQATLRLNTMAHLDITHHFGAKLAERRRGGLILIGSVGAEIGVPFLANDGDAKAYVHSLGEALHYEFKPRGIARDVAELLAALPAPRGSLQEVQKNMPTRIAAMQPHCSSLIRSRSTSAAKASVTSG
jgi:short-subunit dehydrogenase